MDLRNYAVLFGIVFILIGILGFIPGITVDNKLLGLFQVDAIHNSVHLLSGVLALLASAKFSYAGLYFQIFGVIYAIVTIAGFLLNGNLFIMHVNMADNFLHLGIALLALYLGFMHKYP